MKDQRKDGKRVDLTENSKDQDLEHQPGESGRTVPDDEPGRTREPYRRFAEGRIARANDHGRLPLP
jgi:hypothetical protein